MLGSERSAPHLAYHQRQVFAALKQVHAEAQACPDGCCYVLDISSLAASAIVCSDKDNGLAVQCIT